jgi:hypothetical protein
MRSKPRKAVLFLPAAARRVLTPLRFGHESETTPSSSAGRRPCRFLQRVVAWLHERLGKGY